MAREEHINNEANLERMLSDVGLLHSTSSELPKEHMQVIFFGYPVYGETRLPYQSRIGGIYKGKWYVSGCPHFPKDMNEDYEVITWAYIYQ